MRWYWRQAREPLTVATMLVVVMCATSALMRQPGEQVGVPAAGAVQQPGAAGRAFARPTTAQASLAAISEWTQYREDVTGTGVNPTAFIRSDNAASLSLQWRVSHSPGYYTTPAIVDGVVYVTTGLSLFALDLGTGATRWRFDSAPEQRGGIHSSVAVDPAAHLAFYGTPAAWMYAVNLTTGRQAWRRQLGDPSQGAFIWSSPLVVNGRVYIGLASQGDAPCVRGAVFALDEATGQVAWTHYMVPQGALGGSVWSSLVADPAHHEIIATTGNPCPLGIVNAQADSIVGLDWSTGATRWAYHALEKDDGDYDFGEGAVIYTDHGQEYIAAGNKYGQVYVLRRQPNGGVTLAWSAQVAVSDNGLNGGGIFEPPVFQNGLVIFAGGPPPDKTCGLGSLQAFQGDTGQKVWQVCTDGRVIAPAAVSHDVLLVSQSSTIAALNVNTGATLWRAGRPGPAWGGVAVAGGAVIAGTVPGALYSYTLPRPDGLR